MVYDLGKMFNADIPMKSSYYDPRTVVKPNCFGSGRGNKSSGGGNGSGIKSSGGKSCGSNSGGEEKKD